MCNKILFKIIDTSLNRMNKINILLSDIRVDLLSNYFKFLFAFVIKIFYMDSKNLTYVEWYWR